MIQDSAGESFIDAVSIGGIVSRKNCTHRDLAARNCPEVKNNVLKASDSAMSREDGNAHSSDLKDSHRMDSTRSSQLREIVFSDTQSSGILSWETFSSQAYPHSG